MGGFEGVTTPAPPPKNFNHTPGALRNSSYCFLSGCLFICVAICNIVPLKWFSQRFFHAWLLINSPSPSLNASLCQVSCFRPTLYNFMLNHQTKRLLNVIIGIAPATPIKHYEPKIGVSLGGERMCVYTLQGSWCGNHRADLMRVPCGLLV